MTLNMRTFRNSVTAFLLIASLGGLAACGDDDSRPSDSNASDAASEAETASRELPDELDCNALGSVDFRPLLEVVTDSDTSSSGCSWTGLTPTGNTLANSMGFSLKQGLPADYAALRASLGEDVATGAKLSEVPAADGWSYGFAVPVFGQAFDFFGGSRVLGFYLVDEKGNGASCTHTPSYPDDVPYAEEEQYLLDRVPALSELCSQLLSAATS